MGDYERFSAWYEDEGRFLIRMGETCQAAYEALRRHVEESLPLRRRRRYPVHAADPSALGLLAALPGEIRLLLYRRYGLAGNMASLSKAYHVETSQVLELYHHAHVCGKDLLYTLKRTYRTVREIVDRDQAGGGEDEEGRDVEGTLSKVEEALKGMSVPNHRSDVRAVVVNLLYCPLGIRQESYYLEARPCKGRVIVEASAPRRRGSVANESEQVAGIAYQLLLSRLRELYDVPLVLPHAMITAVLSVRHACTRREPDYVSRMCARLVHSYVSPCLLVGKLTLDHLLITKVVTRPPGVLPRTTRLVDVYRAPAQWTPEEVRGIEQAYQTMFQEEIVDRTQGGATKRRIEAIKPLLATVSDTYVVTCGMLGGVMHLKMGCETLREELYSKLPVLPD
jgi:hypothetical protein